MEFDKPFHVGIDGCRGGWLVAYIDAKNKLHHSLISKLSELQTVFMTKVFIDIPLAFASDSYRVCEIEARKLLGTQKASSIFLTPCREAALAEHYEEANRLNRLYLGKGLSIQSWNITKKMLEAIAFKDLNPSLPLSEAHPELSFYLLNGKQAILQKKAGTEGIENRLTVIDKQSGDYLKVIRQTFEQTKRKDCNLDDIVDATILAIRAASDDIQKVPETFDSENGNIFY